MAKSVEASDALAEMVPGQPAGKTETCDLIGLWGIIVQLVLAVVSVTFLVSKKFLHGEKRTWKIFLLDVYKQIICSLFAHFLNVALAIYLQVLTGEGDGCVWYFMNHLLDCFIGMLIAYTLFRIVDRLAVNYGIEELKSGVYVEASVNVLSVEEGG